MNKVVVLKDYNECIKTAFLRSTQIENFNNFYDTFFVHSVRAQFEFYIDEKLKVSELYMEDVGGVYLISHLSLPAMLRVNCENVCTELFVLHINLSVLKSISNDLPEWKEKYHSMLNYSKKYKDHPLISCF